MTDEEINRKFDIVADHLISLAVSQQKSNERIDRVERILLLGIKALRRERKETRETLNALVTAQTRTEETLSRLVESHANLADSLAHTDKRLDALIDIVREGRNGKSDDQPPTKDKK
jgi:flagellar motility protein MotE (MotC chaperone)